MTKNERESGGRRNRWLSVAGFATFAAPILIGLGSAAPSRAQSSAQNAAAAPPVFEYEVASIKPFKPAPGDPPGLVRMGIMTPADGLNATGVTLRDLVQMAYGVQPYQVTGGPDWFGTERLEIDAKIESSVADALAKLSQDDRTVARQKMLQALLADRFKLTIHRETKELPAYTLTIGKNGTKLVEAKPPDPASNAPAQARSPGGGGGGRGGPGRGGPGRGNMMMSMGAGGATINASAVPMANLVRMLSQSLRSPVLDKTGLTGNYDIKLTFMPENFGTGGGPGFATPPGGGGGAPNGAMPPDPAADAVVPTLQVALQEQLGLKLDKGKGQVEIIVIDHAEKASDN